MTLLENHRRALDMGWSVETWKSATGAFGVHAERRYSSGEPHEHDAGITIVHDTLELALARLFRAILPKEEGRSDWEAAHSDGRVEVVR